MSTMLLFANYNNAVSKLETLNDCFKFRNSIIVTMFQYMFCYFLCYAISEIVAKDCCQKVLMQF